jgi:hypothetical protein
MPVTPHTTARPWYDVAPDLDASQDVATLAAYWLTWAAAHEHAYAEALRRGAFEAGRAADPHLMPYMAGFTLAALAKGWAPERIHAALADGATASEFVWQWLHEADIDPQGIESASALAGRVEENIARLNDTTVTHQCPPDGATTMPCCDRTPFEVTGNDRMTQDAARVTCAPTGDVR